MKNWGPTESRGLKEFGLLGEGEQQTGWGLFRTKGGRKSGGNTVGWG